MAQAKRFLSIVESEPGIVAVHCKAGLGRTGTLILMWAMKHFRWGANEAIGYLRWMRPGSIIGPQQQFLKANESRLWKMGAHTQAREAMEAAAARAGQTMHSHTGTNGSSRSSSSAGRLSTGPLDATQLAAANRPTSSQHVLEASAVNGGHFSGQSIHTQDRPTTFGGGGTGSGARRSNGKSRSSSRGDVSSQNGRARVRTGRSRLEGLSAVSSRTNVADEWRNQTSTLRFGRANGSAVGASPGEKPTHHRLTHSLNGYVAAE